MTKQLKRLNIKPPYSTRPMPSSGHRCLTFRKTKYKTYFIVTVKQRGQRQFKCMKLALCYKFTIKRTCNSAKWIYKTRFR